MSDDQGEAIPTHTRGAFLKKGALLGAALVATGCGLPQALGKNLATELGVSKDPRLDGVQLTSEPRSYRIESSLGPFVPVRKGPSLGTEIIGYVRAGEKEFSGHEYLGGNYPGSNPDVRDIAVGDAVHGKWVEIETTSLWKDDKGKEIAVLGSEIPRGYVAENFVSFQPESTTKK